MVELARQLHGGCCARQEVGRGLGRRREGVPGKERVTEICPASAATNTSHDGGEAVTASRLARWLGLAATPTFAIMAVLTAVLGSGTMDMLCAGGDGSPLGGVVPVDFLVSAVPSAAWLKLVSGAARGIRGGAFLRI